MCSCPTSRLGVCVDAFGTQLLQPSSTTCLCKEGTFFPDTAGHLVYGQTTHTPRCLQLLSVYPWSQQKYQFPRCVSCTADRWVLKVLLYQVQHCSWSTRTSRDQSDDSRELQDPQYLPHVRQTLCHVSNNAQVGQARQERSSSIVLACPFYYGGDLQNDWPT